MTKKLAFFFVPLSALAYAIVTCAQPQAPISFADNYYETSTAREKQDILWRSVTETAYDELPELREFGAKQMLAMTWQQISIKGNRLSDFAPQGWVKHIHGRGAVAKVKIVPRENRYTGVFQGADHGILRLSLTYKPVGPRMVAPGLALKVLRDGVYSANVSALYSIDGQGKDFNFFRNALSNIVAPGTGFGAHAMHWLFRKASKYPEQLSVRDMAAIDARGNYIARPVAPAQIFFVPNSDFNFSSEEHDFREDLLGIPAGTVVYRIHTQGEYIADIVTTSEFVASEFGDDGIFFRHQFKD